MKTYKSESDTRPIEWDTTSSRISTYHNYNVKQETRTDGIDSTESRIIFVYDVDEYTKAEYQIYQMNQNRADIAYLSMMTGWEL